MRLSKRRPSGGRHHILEAFKRELVPRLSAVVEQIGVKEIHHAGWQDYPAHFPEIRVILTARDPRDIYVSLYHRVKRGLGTWTGPFGPEPVGASMTGR